MSIIKIHALAEQIKIQEAKDDYKDIEWVVNSAGDINNYLSLLVSRHGDEDKRQHDYLDFQALENPHIKRKIFHF